MPKSLSKESLTEDWIPFTEICFTFMPGWLKKKKKKKLLPCGPGRLASLLTWRGVRETSVLRCCRILEAKKLMSTAGWLPEPTSQMGERENLELLEEQG